ncbi:uncharacterized protein BKA55DRAFT_706512 [Fusarium redolens]|uniref:Uncharacterized protein n=1 Tax=Fusarium redolens TaxID=48865 RepID=A0A9P9GJZ1_FUSRE|nr:uncharacterized protein BKA55DRAFT_706512 [Fusarium redolens]KAH7240053.1 hypothetical protein BKA55DRAFT_706512 [Fusarium redolens]
MLVIVLSFWRRFDYYYKASEPWRELQSGPALGSRSLLLDYVSPFQLQSIYQAYKFRHYRIIPTILSFFLLKAIILVSTTLFLVHASSHSVTSHITYQDTFDAANAWSWPPFNPAKYPSLDGYDLYGGSDKFIWNYLARTNSAVANDSDWNVRDGRVTQRFAPAVSTLNMTSLKASVDAFLPIVDCEQANLFVDLPADVADMQYYWNSTTCSTWTTHDIILPRPSSFVDGAAVICKIGYNIAPATTTYEIPRTTFPWPLRKMTERQALVVNKDVTPLTSSLIFNGWHTTDSLFQLLAGKLGNQFEPGVFLKPSVLLNTSIVVLSGLLDEFARASLLVSKASNGTAEGRVSEIRLHTKNEAFWIMASGFTVLAILCLLLLFTPVNGLWVPAMYGSIAGHAAVLVNSRPLQEALQVLGDFSDKEKSEELNATLSTASVGSDRVFSINLVDRSQPSIKVSHHEKSTVRKPWAPVSGRLYFVVVTLFSPILAIIALELLHRLYNKRDGLFDIPETDSIAMLYVVRLSSTAAAFSIATLINNFDFTIATFAPFSSLRLGNVQAERRINLNLIRHGGTITPTRIWQDLVLPDVSLVTSDSLAQKGLARTSKYIYTVGALRPLLECSVIPKTNHIRTVERSQYNVPEYYIETIRAFYVPQGGCRGQFRYVGNTSFGFQETASKDFLNSTKSVGRYFDLDANKSNSSSSCPSIGILFGTIGGLDTSQWNNLTALVCSQGIEQIPVRVTYRGNHALGQISERHPPESEALGYSLEGHFRHYLAFFHGQTGWSLDSFFDQLLHRPDGRKFEDLHVPENIDALVKAIEKDYSEYMRHVINLNFRAYTNTTLDELVSSEGDRSAAKPLSAHTTITGTEFGQVTRLAIDSTSKLILQILLAVIAVLNLTSYLLVKIDGHFRGIHAVSQAPWPSLLDLSYALMIQLKQAFDGWVFSLGWWQKEGASVEESDGDTSTFGDTDPPSNEAQKGQRTVGRFGIDVGRANVSKF